MESNTRFHTIDHLYDIMNSIQIQSYSLEDRIRELATQLDAEVEEDCEEYSIVFNNNHGNGHFKGINYDHGIATFTCDLLVKEELKITYRLGRRHPILFMFCSVGELHAHTTPDDISQSMSNHDGVIFAPRGDNYYSITVPAEKQCKFIIVDIIRYLFLRKIICDLDTIPDDLKSMFQDTTGEKAFVFKDTISNIGLQSLHKVLGSDQTGLERKLMVESHSLMLVTSLMERFRKRSSGEKGVQFRKADLQNINVAKDYIIDHFQKEVTIKYLSKLTGLNPNKLQKGFRLLFGKSVRQFLITLRMQVALRMLDEGELSVSEVAHSVGYTNKGHFSQLFKKEFGLLPSVYQHRAPLV